MKTKHLIVILFLMGLTPTFAQSGEEFIGEIKIFAGNFAPRGWAKCEGQLLQISQNTALFSLIGTTYGGNGQTTFALPNLRERVVVGPGQGSGLSNYSIGQTGGAASVTILTANLPSHTHSGALKVSSAPATTATPSATASIAAAKNNFNNIDNTVRKYSAAAGNVTINAGTTSNAGGSTPLNVAQPYLVSNFIIALQGTYPSQP